MKPVCKSMSCFASRMMLKSLENGGWPMHDDPIASAKTWQELALV